MTLEGDKKMGTDLHSRTASILGISRSDAKVFNYGRIYGAGQKFATQLLRQFNPTLPEADALSTAAKLYAETKGKKTTRKALHERAFWRGGTESLVFNRLEDFAEQTHPRTPVLGAGITEALQRNNISRGGFLTSRINWAIQSSGVDYLHLLIVSMDYLARLYNLNTRLSITVHDEIRYLCREEDKYKVAMALQIANLWTRAIFAQQLGIEDLPQSCAFFSAVDIDHVLRKEVDMDCITPSHPKAIPHGESLDIQALLAKGEEARLVVPQSAATEMDLKQWTYEARTPVIQDLDVGSDSFYLRAQITSDDNELKSLIKSKLDTLKPSKPTTLSKALKPSTSSGNKGSTSSGNRGRPRKIKGWTGQENRGLFEDAMRIDAGAGMGVKHYRNEARWLMETQMQGNSVAGRAEMEWERRYSPGAGVV
jgi:DNA polymerase gamma 1